ncbi:MAG: M23 family metallopeptidase [Cyclobacteriaceae bacterium]
MKELSQTQILYIDNDLKSKGLADHKAKNEILDHICCMVEIQMNDGIPFNKAYEKSLDHFNDDGFKNLKSELRKSGQSRSFTSTKIITTGIAACVLMLVLVVEAQDRPNIHPIGSGHEITSDFGMRMEPIQKVKKFHRGIDIRVKEGTVVKATASGTVINAKESDAYGKYVIIIHDNHIRTLYAHLSSFSVKEGQKVSKEQQIGLSGNTGKSTAPHLHYEIIENGNYVNPLDYIKTN